MTAVLWGLVLLPVAVGAYAYVGYPALLWAAVRLGSARRAADDRHGPPGGPAGAASAPRDWPGAGEWPRVSITMPAYNEAATIADTLEALLALDYPADRLQILVTSDASTDGTEDVVGRFLGRGVELLRLPARGGKTAAENAAVSHLRGEIVITVDATIRVPPGSLKPLVAAFADPTVGVASGRDVSVGGDEVGSNNAESDYVGYEMKIRSLETRVGSIVGASGCFYAMRRALYAPPVPPHLSRDFAAALVAREAGFRAVSVDEAVCLVPRSGSLRSEFRRKRRTMERGLRTLAFKRHLLDPFRHGRFAWLLASHKLARWAVPAVLPAAGLGLLGLALTGSGLALGVLGAAAVAAGAAAGALAWPEHRRVPRPIGTVGYGVVGLAAGVAAWVGALRGESIRTWEPTRRRPAGAGSG